MNQRILVMELQPAHPYFQAKLAVVDPDNAEVTRWFDLLDYRKGACGNAGSSNSVFGKKTFSRHWVYRAALTSIAQTTPPLQNKFRVPVVDIGGVAGLGVRVGEMVPLVAETVPSVLVPDSGYFVPEERRSRSYATCLLRPSRAAKHSIVLTLRLFIAIRE